MPSRPYLLHMADTNDDTKIPPRPPAESPKPETPPMPAEIGGPKGPEPTRYGDWERKGLAVDF